MKRSLVPCPKDTDAQWLLLSAIVVAVGLCALILLLNMAILSGHSSTQSIMSFPKNEIRDLRALSISEAAVIGHGVNANSSITDKSNAFVESFDRFIGETDAYYQLHGTLSDISCVPAYDAALDRITSVSLDMTFEDGTTFYSESITVGIN